MTQTTLINLHPKECSQGFHCYPFAVKLDRCLGSCNTLNDLSNKMCAPNKAKNLNLSVFDMITGKNESKILTKDISCECKFKFDGRKCNSDQWRNNDRCQCECKKRHVYEKDYIWNSSKCSCENGKYLTSVIVDSVTTCYEIIGGADAEVKSHDEETNTILPFYIQITD